ncbi:MAG: PQQ-binding-like beta-propeller repeat protein [Pseudomonadota bacterium]
MQSMTAAAALLLSLATMAEQPTGDLSWQHYGGSLAGDRYSPHRQLTPDNVQALRQVWQFRTGDAADGSQHSRSSSFKATPILFDGLLYVVSGFNRVYALAPDTGELRWRFDPKVDFGRGYSELFTARGVSAWRGPGRGTCASRIYLGTLDARLIALDSESGRPCEDFGQDGAVDLSRGIANFRRGEYSLTSPVTVVGSTLIVGSSIGDNGGVRLEPGTVRAFGARSGDLKWSFDPVPKDSRQSQASGWDYQQAVRTGGGNMWSVASASEALGLVYVPTTSPSPDFFGGERKGSNNYANSVVALDLESGAVRWHFQTVHHDLWDYDLAAQPALTRLSEGGPLMLLQATKMGHLFALNAATGEPLFPVSERAVPTSGVPGEAAAATQPFPAPALALHPDSFELWDHSPAMKSYCAGLLEGRRWEGLFTPPSLEGSVLYPGNGGGTNWGSMSVDAARGVAVLGINRLPTVVELIPRKDFKKRRRKEEGGPQGVQFTSQSGTPFGMARYDVYDPERVLPCHRGPWGTWVAVDLRQGRVLWETPAGPFPNAKDHPEARNWGSLLSGGPVMTAGGLTLAPSRWDRTLMVMASDTGDVLARITLPAQPQATPMTYQMNGRQYVVLTAGGSQPEGSMPGDFVLAFALPE